MSRIRLKCGGKKRHKAMLGADGAVMAAATLAAAAINAGATAAAAKSQAKAVTESAKTQAQSIKDQTTNSNNLQKEQLAFTRSQNQENRQQQQDIQTTLQLMAGQENMNDRMEKNKMQVKFGGKPKRKSVTTPFYGGGQFQVTDGGGAIPLSITPEGFGLYELYGNDHEHYHKTAGGKNKTGVGIKFNDGSVVEGEGNQNTNQGELLYVTPNDAMFISKHSIDGFNPTQAVKQGIHPEQAFAIQEVLKNRKGLNDDGSKSKRRSVKRMLGGPTPYLEQANMTQNPNNGTASVASGVLYNLNRQTTSPVEELKYNNAIAKHGGRIHLKCGGRRKASWGDYAGATYNAIGNVAGAGISTLGNMFAANRLGKAYNEAGNILADAYSKMHGIDMSELKMEDYAAPHTLAVIRDSNNLSYDPQRERVLRNAASERRAINSGTLSSAARQQRLAATNDRALQRISEIDATENNARETIRQGNAERITQIAQANADRDVQARKDFTSQRMALLQYNNDIENAKIAGMAQARADALTQSSTAHAQGMQASMSAIGNSLVQSGQAFATAHNNAIKSAKEDAYAFAGLSSPEKKAFVMSGKAPNEAKTYYMQQMEIFKNATSKKDKDVAFANIQAIINKYPKLGLTLPMYAPDRIGIDLAYVNRPKLPNKIF